MNGIRNFRVRVAAGVLAAGSVLGCAAAMGQAPDEQAPAMAMGAGRGVRGTVTAVKGDRITVKTEAGEVYQIVVTPNTQVRKGREPGKLADVHVGDGVGAGGEMDAPNKTVHALFVAVVDAEQIKKAREAMGKTFIAGTVKAIDEVKLTILRSDNVTQVIQVDEDTSFRKGGRGMQGMMSAGGGMGGERGGGERGAGGDRGGGARGPRPATTEESITLADVKVGDAVAGPGALKSGVFVPTQLAVMDPAVAAAGRRRRTDGAAGTRATEPK